VKNAAPEVEMTRNEMIAYLAGFFDGEGHIQIAKHSKRGSYMLKITCVQATTYPLGEYVKMFGGTIAEHDFIYRGTPKRHWTWQASSKSAEMALREMQPYIIAKKDELEVALKFRSTFRPKFGDRSKMDASIIEDRRGMMIDLQEIRKAKRTVAA
jgi:hypothetical protein